VTTLDEPLVAAAVHHHDRTVPPESLIYREEVTAILGVLAGINVRLRQIYELLEEEFDGEEGPEEGDS
jgi:hypothetical protein